MIGYVERDSWLSERIGESKKFKEFFLAPYGNYPLPIIVNHGECLSRFFFFS